MDLTIQISNAKLIQARIKTLYFFIYSSTTTKAFNGPWISVSSVLGLGAQGGVGAGKATPLQTRPLEGV